MSLMACAGLPPKTGPVRLAKDAPLSDMPGGGSWPIAEWWKQYRDEDLDRLIDMALQNSPTVATAQARFDSARQSVRLAGAVSGAQIDASGETSRQRLSDNGLFPPRLLGFHWYNLEDLGLRASYTFDWWGKQKDSVEAAMDEAHAAQADRAAAALVLASSVADAYFGWQSDQSRLSLARERETMVAREGAILDARIGADLESPDERQRATSNLAAVRGQIAEFDGSARLRIVALAALVGQPTADLPALKSKAIPVAHAGLPDDVRLDLIARRADLTASRWRVEAAQKNRDSARADFLPDISINALVGLQSVDLGKLFEYASRVPSVTAAVHLPIFDGGRLKARYGATQAAVDAAVASYRETLIGAAREVAIQAATSVQIGAERSQRVIEVDAAERLKSSAAARVRQGLSDSRAELAASESWLVQRDALLQLDAAALSSDIGLKRALGGGYERNDKSP